MAEKRKGSGCCMYGCVGAALVFMLAITGMYFGARWGLRKLLAWSDTAPMTLPSPQLPGQDFQDLTNRVRVFAEGLEGNTPQLLSLGENELNVLLTNLPQGHLLDRRFYLTIVSNELVALAAIPLTNIGGPFAGHWVNMRAKLDPGLSNGLLTLRIADVEIKGKRPPAELVASIAKQDLAEDLATNTTVTDVTRQLESIVITNNQLLIRSKSGETP